MSISRREQRPSMPGGQGEQGIVLKSAETYRLVVPKDGGKKPASIQERFTPRWRLDRNEGRDELLDGTTRLAACAAEKFACHDWG